MTKEEFIDRVADDVVDLVEKEIEFTEEQGFDAVFLTRALMSTLANTIAILLKADEVPKEFAQEEGQYWLKKVFDAWESL